MSALALACPPKLVAGGKQHSADARTLCDGRRDRRAHVLSPDEASRPSSTEDEGGGAGEAFERFHFFCARSGHCLFFSIPIFLTLRMEASKAEELPLPAAGARFSLGAFRGTVRYVGAVPPTEGVWLGVEWDDASRGKHDGTHQGVYYFACRSVDEQGSATG